MHVAIVGRYSATMIAETHLRPVAAEDLTFLNTLYNGAPAR